MQIRAPKSIGFGAKRAEKSPYKRTIPYDASLGAGCRRFKSCRLDHFSRTQINFEFFFSLQKNNPKLLPMITSFGLFFGGGDGGNRNRVQNQFTEGSTSVGCLLSYPLTHRRQSAYVLRYSLIPDESRDTLSFMFATESTPCPKPWHSSAERKLLITQQELLIYYCQLIFKLLLFKRCNSATR